MGVLEQRREGDANRRSITLGAQCLLGRNPACAVQLADRQVSGEHASLHWVGSHWELRDLGSRNGTFVGARRLAAGERVQLAQGDSFSLGKTDTCFVLVDAGAPAVLARHVSSGATRASEDAVLVLPDDDHPLASVFQEPGGQWVIELADARRPISDQDRVQLDGAWWTIHVPLASTETWESGKPSLRDIHLRMGVSQDEEHVEITVVHEGRRLPLPPRAFHYMLVTLARLWLEDAGAEAERGWVDREKLSRMLATDLNKLNVDIHRARKQLSELGILGAASIVERREGTGQLRLGVRSVEVFRL